MTDIDPTAAYPVTPRNRVKRLHERGTYDRASVWAVLDASMLCHVAYAIDGQPYATPTIHWRDGDTLFWHGSSASRMLRHLAKGAPACLTVSHLDRLILARCGFNHSVDYRSAMCFGTARIVDDIEEKRTALDRMIDRYYPGRAASLRTATAQEIKATTVISMVIEEASAKVRAKGVGDEPEDLDLPIWAGVIPLHTVIGEAEVSPHVPAGVDRPADLAAYRPGRSLGEVFAETQAIYEGE
ncbi:pyridoxamine 5'-phosphate oxidase family protein [Pinisolibacter sp.]|uniref:pyridoxamine 5'-phosphate oxidase family protein n=1 Tax=Pinisolibacter sp. TaxID=2172024 RepID=UPI002FDD2022